LDWGAGECGRVGELTHTHNLLYEGSGNGRGEAEDVIVVVVGSEPGGQSAGQSYREGAGRRMVGDRRLIRNVVDGEPNQPQGQADGHQEV